MPDTFDRQLRDLLEEEGCRHIRHGKGSHQIWWSPKTQRNFPVPAGIKSRHTANGILRQAGINKRI